METIYEKYDNIADATRQLSDLVDAAEGTEWRTKHLQVTHAVQPENAVVINGVWCDIGQHKVVEDAVRFSEDASVCNDCYEHYN